MSQAIAQSATLLSVSTPTEIDYAEMVARLAMRSVKGVTRERVLLNNNKLMQSCRLEYKSKRNMSSDSRLPDEVERKLQECVNEFITKQINRIHVGNALTVRVYDALDFRNFAVVEKVSATGQNILALQAQLEGCNRLLRAAKDKLANYEKQSANGNSSKDYTDLIARGKEYINKLEFVKEHVRKTIQETNKTT